MGTNVPRALRKLLLEYYSRDNSNSRTLLIQISEHCKQWLEPKLKQASTADLPNFWPKNNQFFNVAKKIRRMVPNSSEAERLTIFLIWPFSLSRQSLQRFFFNDEISLCQKPRPDQTINCDQNEKTSKNGFKNYFSVLLLLCQSVDRNSIPGSLQLVSRDRRAVLAQHDAHCSSNSQVSSW